MSADGPEPLRTKFYRLENIDLVQLWTAHSRSRYLSNGYMRRGVSSWCFCILSVLFMLRFRDLAHGFTIDAGITGDFPHRDPQLSNDYPFDELAFPGRVDGAFSSSSWMVALMITLLEMLNRSGQNRTIPH